jgi:predicted HTH transcriptional regulator
MAESQNIEYKESWRDEYLKWICGFANAQGGTIYIGIDDAGNVVGVKDIKKLMEDIPNKIQSGLGIIADVNKHTKDGKDYTPKGHSAKNDGTLDDTMAYKIIEVIRSKPDITLDQLSTETGIARRTLVRYMSALKEAGRIERVGGKRYGHWEIRDDMK